MCLWVSYVEVHPTIAVSAEICRNTTEYNMFTVIVACWPTNTKDEIWISTSVGCLRKWNTFIVSYGKSKLRELVSEVLWHF
jgi:hypothetical protein